MAELVDLSENVYEKTISIKEFYEIFRSPFQRDEEYRAGTKKVQSAISKYRREHSRIDLAELTESCLDEKGVFYPAGTLFVQNGNTRRFMWKNNMTDKVPKFVRCTVYKCKDLKEVKENYFTFDSTNSVESNKEKFAAMIKNLNGFVATNKKVQRGEVWTPCLFTAVHLFPHLYDKKDTVVTKGQEIVAEFMEEIKIIDRYCKNEKRWDTSLLSAAVMAIRKYGTNNSKLLKALDDIDKNRMNTHPDQKDGVTHICLEWVKGGNKFKTTHLAKSTVWDDLDTGLVTTVSYALYWIEKHMNDVPLCHAVGFEKTAENWFDKKWRSRYTHKPLLSVVTSNIKKDDK
jgi:hypothetical protein